MKILKRILIILILFVFIAFSGVFFVYQTGQEDSFLNIIGGRWIVHKIDNSWKMRKNVIKYTRNKKDYKALPN